MRKISYKPDFLLTIAPGKIVATIGDLAWVNYGTDEDPECGSIRLHNLERADD
jgi:hypothetical protein